MTMKIAIVGTSPSSTLLAPYNDESWTIWACSQGNMGKLPRVSAWFELHSVNDLTGVENRGWSLNYFAWLKAQSFPVYMQEKNEYVPGAIVYPMRKMLDTYGHNWFTSSIAYMLAYAISLGPTEIGIFGVDMAATEEHYSSQKAGCIRFIEIAREKGITVSIPHESCLASPPPLYGYAEASRMGRKLIVRNQEIKLRLGQIDAEIARLTNERHYFAGALENNEYIRRTWVDGSDAEIDGDGLRLIGGH